MPRIPRLRKGAPEAPQAPEAPTDQQTEVTGGDPLAATGDPAPVESGEARTDATPDGTAGAATPDAPPADDGATVSMGALAPEAPSADDEPAGPPGGDPFSGTTPSTDQPAESTPAETAPSDAAASSEPGDSPPPGDEPPAGATAIGDPLSGPTTSGAPLSGSTASGDPLAAPTTSGDPLGSPSTSGDPLGSPTTSGDPLGSPTTSGDPLGSPTTSGDPLGAPTTSGDPLAEATSADPATVVAPPAGGAVAAGEVVTPGQDSATVVEEAPADAAPGFRERARIRRRLRYLRRYRELAFRDLGGLTFDLHRFGRERPDLLSQKLDTLSTVDRELRALEGALRERRDVTELREVGVAACPRCQTLHGTDANFCPGCGTALRGAVVRDAAPVTVAAPAEPQPAPAADAPTTQQPPPS